jgi:lipoprotein NlpI
MRRMGDTARADAELKRRLAIPPDGSESLSWTLVLFRHFAGESNAAAVMKVVRSAGPELRDRRICEASFYLGEFAAIEGKTKTATAMLTQAVSACRITSIEHVTAKTALARLAQ